MDNEKELEYTDITNLDFKHNPLENIDEPIGRNGQSVDKEYNMFNSVFTNTDELVKECETDSNQNTYRDNSSSIRYHNNEEEYDVFKNAFLDESFRDEVNGMESLKMPEFNIEYNIVALSYIDVKLEYINELDVVYLCDVAFQIDGECAYDYVMLEISKRISVYRRMLHSMSYIEVPVPTALIFRETINKKNENI